MADDNNSQNENEQKNNMDNILEAVENLGLKDDVVDEDIVALPGGGGDPYVG